MPDGRTKRIVLRALQRCPDFSGIATMPLPRSRKGRGLLQWLDQSGLALSFLTRVQSHENGARLPDEWRNVLEPRRERNAIRFQDMLMEFQRLNYSFHARGILAITLKGFSLVPDFCEDPGLRHQTDFDFLVAQDDVEAAAAVLVSCGYSTARLSNSEESCFTTPHRHVPTSKDDLYAIQHHRQVDLHVSLAENTPWITLDSGLDVSKDAVPMLLDGAHFHGLALADRFVAQVLHAFRHSFRSWIRLSWLMEIGHCMELHQENEALWTRVMERAGRAPLTKRIFALVLSLTNRLFHSRIPPRLRSWFADGLTPSLRVWLDYFSVNWAISDWPGNLSNLFLAPEFIPGKKLRMRYLASRLIPKRERLTIETMARHEKKKSLAWNLQRWRYVAHRSGVHLRDLLYLPLEQLRWKRALAAARAGLVELDS